MFPGKWCARRGGGLVSWRRNRLLIARALVDFDSGLQLHFDFVVVCTAAAHLVHLIYDGAAA